LLDGEIYWWYVLVEVSIFLKSFDTSVVDSITKTAEMVLNTISTLFFSYEQKKNTQLT